MLDRPSGRVVVAVVLAILVVALVSVETLTGSPYAGWPAGGLAGALALVCPPGRRLLVLGPVLVAVVAVAVVGSDSLLMAAGIVLARVVPAVVCLGVLQLVGPGPRISVDTAADHLRYDAAVLAVALLAGATSTALAVPRLTLDDALELGLVSALASGSGLLVVLPHLFTPERTQPDTDPRERAAVRLCLAVNLALLVIFDQATLVLYFQLAVFAWAATRLARREVLVHLTVFSLVAYGWAVLEYGVLALPEVGDSVRLGPTLLFAYVTACAYVVVPLATLVDRLNTSTARERRTADASRRLFAAETSTVVVGLDADGVVTHFNNGAESVLGWSAAEAVGMTPAAWHPPEAVSQVAARLGCPEDLEAVSQAQSASGTTQEWPYVARDGSRGVLALAVHDLHDPETGETVGRFSIGDDVTARERASAALAAALDHEQEASLVKQVLVSTVSHELRTPITSIRGYAEMLVDGDMGHLSDHQRSAVDRILRNSDRLGALADDLLTLSRAEAGQLVVENARVDLAELVAEVVASQRLMTQDRDVVVRLDVPRRPVEVRGDRPALERVAHNLVGNAVKFTPDGGEVVVSVSATREGVRLEVRDTGIGIAEEDRPLLFTRFFRARSATDAQVPGTGLDLSIVRAVVLAHDGCIDVASELGRGTTVTVDLPALS